MSIYCRGKARIQHKVTGKIYDIECEELDWDVDGSDERQMGPEIHHEAVLEHPDLGDLNWSLWEYPVGVENDHKYNVGEHIVVKDFDYGLVHD